MTSSFVISVPSAAISFRPSVFCLFFRRRQTTSGGAGGSDSIHVLLTSTRLESWISDLPTFAQDVQAGIAPIDGPGFGLRPDPLAIGENARFGHVVVIVER